MSFPLPNPDDPSDPGLPAPLFADVDAVRGDQLRAFCQLLWGNFAYIENNFDSKAKIAAIAAALTGYSVGPDTPLAASDLVLAAFGKLQGQRDALAARVVTLEARPYVVYGTAQATTSGTAINFNGLPSGVKKIFVSISSLSTSGTSRIVLRIGDSGGIESSGYASYATTNGTDANSSTGFIGSLWGASGLDLSGLYILTLLDPSTNTWVLGGEMSSTNQGRASVISGVKSLSAVLDRIQLTTEGGSDTFTAGKVNISYEVS